MSYPEFEISLPSEVEGIISRLFAKEGDFVSLSGGSKHYSHSPSGCVIVVTHRGKVVDLDKEEM